jgi:hypothetical protein
MKKRIFNYLLQSLFLIMMAIGTTSCLKGNLDELPAFIETEITDVKFDYRYKDETDKWVDGEPIVKVIKLNVATKTIDKVAGTITCTLTIPPASGSFTNAIRSSISLTSIVGKFNLSTAASIAPLDGAPVLGVPGDFSAERKFKVTAADGKTTQIWTIKINPLPVINKFEGMYVSTGHFDHPTSPRDLNSEKYLSSLDASTVSCDHSDLGSSGYTLTIKINADNTLVVKQFSPGELGEMVPGAINKYDPATKTFTLNYRYMGGNGWRSISETLKLK